MDMAPGSSFPPLEVILQHQIPEPPSKPTVSIDEAGLKALIGAGHLAAAFNLTTQLLTLPQYESTPQAMEIWACRFQLYLALKMHAELLQEIEQLGDLDDHSSLLDSTLPFSIRLIHAEAPLYSPDAWTSLTRVLILENATAEAAQKQQPTEVWTKRLHAVRLLKARIFYRLKEHKAALNVYEEMLHSLSSNEEEKRALLKTLVRLCIVIGDEKGVDRFIRQLADLQAPDSEQALYQCFKAIFSGEVEAAYKDISNVNREEGADLKSLNNEAICMLYNGRVEPALQLLMRQKGALAEPMTINLEIISDLGCTSTSARKFKR